MGYIQSYLFYLQLVARNRSLLAETVGLLVF